jgi:alpha/beta superfamily hydrolase
VLIAPTVGTHDYEAFRGTANPLLVVAPDRDFAADAARLAEWFHTLTALRRLVRGEWDDHFFRGFEDELAGVVHSFLHGQWGVGG